MYTPWSLNSLFKAILHSLFDYPFGRFCFEFPSSFLSKHLQSSPQIVRNTPNMPPSNFLKKSLNSLFIDPGVCVDVCNTPRQLEMGRII